MQFWDEYKDLKTGDQVEFENVYVHAGLYISGKGTVSGFGRFGSTPVIWIDLDNGEKEAIAYEFVKKIAPVGNISQLPVNIYSSGRKPEGKGDGNGM